MGNGGKGDVVPKKEICCNLLASITFFSIVEDRIVVKCNLRNMCRIYVSLIMAPVRQFICVTEW